MHKTDRAAAGMFRSVGHQSSHCHRSQGGSLHSRGGASQVSDGVKRVSGKFHGSENCSGKWTRCSGLALLSPAPDSPQGGGRNPLGHDGSSSDD